MSLQVEYNIMLRVLHFCGFYLTSSDILYNRVDLGGDLAKVQCADLDVDYLYIVSGLWI